MSRIEKSLPSPYVAQTSKWSNVWNWNDYFLPENVKVFEEIYAYFKTSLASGVGYHQIYLNWMADKGAIRLTKYLGRDDWSVISDHGYSDEQGKMSFENYERHRDMWTKFTDWMHHKEQKAEAAAKFERESIENLTEKVTVEPIQVEDDVTKSALDNF